MSSATEGWYVDPSTGTNLRFWNGITWTDEVAPLPQEPADSGPVDLLAAARAPAPEGATVPAEESPPLDPDVERTRLSRRELRARRGQAEVDDAPKHLPPMEPPAAVSTEHWAEAMEHVEVPPPAAPAEPAGAPVADADRERRRRVLRLSALLGVLAVVTSFAVVTAGTLWA